MVVTFRRSVSAILVALALVVGQAGVCAGWLPTPEARMACCAGDGSCRMHEPASSHAGTPHTVSQTEADHCCAASEPDDSAPSPSSITVSIVTGGASIRVLSVLPEPNVRLLFSRALMPIPQAHVARHVLLSVFLV